MSLRGCSLRRKTGKSYVPCERTGNPGVCYSWVPPALTRTTVLSPATGALSCVTACPQGSAVHTHSSDHHHGMEAKVGWIKELAYGWWMEIPLATSEVQSVHVKWGSARCCKIGKYFSVVTGTSTSVLGLHYANRVNGRMDSCLFVFFPACYYLEEKKTLIIRS